MDILSDSFFIIRWVVLAIFFWVMCRLIVMAIRRHRKTLELKDKTFELKDLPVGVPLWFFDEIHLPGRKDLVIGYIVHRKEPILSARSYWRVTTPRIKDACNCAFEIVEEKGKRKLCRRNSAWSFLNESESSI